MTSPKAGGQRYPWTAIPDDLIVDIHTVDVGDLHRIPLFVAPR